MNGLKLNWIVEYFHLKKLLSNCYRISCLMLNVEWIGLNELNWLKLGLKICGGQWLWRVPLFRSLPRIFLPGWIGVPSGRDPGAASRTSGWNRHSRRTHLQTRFVFFIFYFPIFYFFIFLFNFWIFNFIFNFFIFEYVIYFFIFKYLIWIFNFLIFNLIFYFLNFTFILIIDFFIFYFFLNYQFIFLNWNLTHYCQLTNKKIELINELMINKQ